MKDVTLTETAGTVSAKGVTLDLGGNTVTYAPVYTKADYVALINVSGELTITGEGTITGPAGAEGAVYDGKVIISAKGEGAVLNYLDGTLTAGGEGADGMYGVLVANGAKAVFGDEETGEGPSIATHFAAIGMNNLNAPVDVTVYGGNYSAAADPGTDATWWHYFCAPVYASCSGDITIAGGTFEGFYGLSSRYSNVEQQISVTGGTFLGSSGTAFFVGEATGSGMSGERSIDVSGGWFTDPVADENVADGMYATELMEDAPYAAAPYTVAWLKVIPVPEAKDLTYTATKQTGVEEGEGYTIEGNTGTNAGNYTAKAELKRCYIWDDGTTEPKDIAWSIAKAPLPMPEDMSAQTYTGSAIEPVVIKFNGEELQANVDYTAAYVNNVNVGTATVILIGGGNFEGMNVAQFEIVEVNKDDLEMAIGLSSGATIGIVIQEDDEGLEPGAVYWHQADVDTFEAALEEAQAVFDNPNVTQDEVDAATEALYDALVDFANAAQHASAQLTIEATDTVFAGEDAPNAPDEVTVTLNGVEQEAGAYALTYYEAEPTQEGWQKGAQIDHPRTTGYFYVEASMSLEGDATAKADWVYEVKPIPISEDSYVLVTNDPITYKGEQTEAAELECELNGEAFAPTALNSFVYYTDDNSGAKFDQCPKDLGDYTVHILPFNYDSELTGTFSIKQIEIEIPTAVEGLVYSASEQSGVAEGEGYMLDGALGVNARSYTATATLSDPANAVWSDGTVEPKEIAWSIAKAPLPTPESIDPQPYTGSAITPVVIMFNGQELQVNVDYTAAYVNNVNVGTATAILIGGGNFEGMYAVQFEIVSGVDREALAGAIDDAEAATEGITVSEDGAGLAPGTEYWTPEAVEALQDAIDAAQAVYDDPNVTQAEVDAAVQALQQATTDFNDAKKTATAQVEVPTAIEGLVFNGTEQAGVAEGVGYELDGAEQTNAGAYKATATLSDTESTAWSDGTTEPKEIAWSIAKADVAGATVETVEPTEYTGKPVEGVVSVTLGEGAEAYELAEGTDYDVYYINNDKPGTATAIVVGKAPNFTGLAIASFEITQNTDRSALEDAIDDAKDDEDDTKVSETGDDVDPSEQYVPQAAKDALDKAIADAQAVFDDPAATQDEIDAATAAVKEAQQAFDDAKKNGTHEWSRLAGQMRYNTMQEIVSAGWESSDWAVVATGANFPDALGAAALAGLYQCPIVLVPADVKGEDDQKSLDIGLAELERMGVENVMFLGGKLAVSDAVAGQVGRVVSHTERVAGADRYDTSKAAYQRFRQASSGYDTIIVANGVDYAEALSIAPYAYAKGVPMVLAHPSYGLSLYGVANEVKADANVKNVVIVSAGGLASQLIKDQLGSGYSYTDLVAGDSFAMNKKVVDFEVANGMSLAKPVVASGKNYPDALAGGALAGKWNSALALVANADSAPVSSIVAAKEGIGHGYVLGGPYAVSYKTCTGIADKTDMVFVEDAEYEKYKDMLD